MPISQDYTKFSYIISLNSHNILPCLSHSSLKNRGKNYKICSIWSGDCSGRKTVIFMGNTVEIVPGAGVQWLLNVFHMTIMLVTVWCQPTFLTLSPILPHALGSSLMATIMPKLFSCHSTNRHAPSTLSHLVCISQKANSLLNCTSSKAGWLLHVRKVWKKSLLYRLKMG